MTEKTINERLIDAGCEKFTYEGQDGEFIGKNFPLKTICDKLGLDEEFVDSTMYDSDYEYVKGGVIVEFICETGEIQYHINGYFWECTNLETPLGKKLLNLLEEL